MTNSIESNAQMFNEIMTRIDNLQLEDKIYISEKTIKFTLKKINGQIFENLQIVEIPANYTVLDLKKRLSARDQIPNKWISLLYRGKPLKDEQLLEQYNLNYESTIYMAIIAGINNYFVTNKRHISK